MFAAVPIFPDSHTAVAVDLPSAPGADTYISARFYGPDHEEITGVFGTDAVIGAFGTMRQ